MAGSRIYRWATLYPVSFGYFSLMYFTLQLGVVVSLSNLEPVTLKYSLSSLRVGLTSKVIVV